MYLKQRPSVFSTHVMLSFLRHCKASSGTATKHSSWFKKDSFQVAQFVLISLSINQVCTNPSKATTFSANSHAWLQPLGLTWRHHRAELHHPPLKGFLLTCFVSGCRTAAPQRLHQAQKGCWFHVWFYDSAP